MFQQYLILFRLSIHNYQIFETIHAKDIVDAAILRDIIANPYLPTPQKPRFSQTLSRPGDLLIAQIFLLFLQILL